LSAKVGQGLLPGSAATVRQGVVGHDAFDCRDAQRGEMRGGAPQKVGAGAGFLVGVDFGVGQPGAVVDRGVHVFVAGPGAGAGSAAFEAVTAVHPPAAVVAEPADLLDVDVDQLAGPAHPGLDVRAGLGGQSMRGAGRIGQADVAFGAPPGEPFVAGGAGHADPPRRRSSH